MISPAPPKLEERFLEPPGFRWHNFERNGRKIRFGCAAPHNAIPQATIVCLPGLSEFSEKYFELAHDFLKNDLSFWIIDWMGQGKSGRYLPNAHKRHADGFENDVADLKYMIEEYIKPASVHTDVGRIPLAMIGHSMGAHLGLRYLAEHPGMFECAALSSPFLGIHKLSNTPDNILIPTAKLLNTMMGKSYAFGQKNWSPEQREYGSNNIFSADRKRTRLHNAWCQFDPELKTGGVTFGWVYEALQSCKTLKSELKNIQTPCVLAKADLEVIVDNNAIEQAIDIMPNAELLELNKCLHEILMESNEKRNKFINAFYQLIRKTIIDKPESTKPF